MSQPISTRLPDFIVVGPGRTGTTWLDQVMRQHVCLPRGIKETHFFSLHYQRGIEWYGSHFKSCAASQLAGEICGYFPYPEVPVRIRRHLPRCRIVVTVRDPVERTYSHYKMMRANGFTARGLSETLERDPYLGGASRYGKHLPRWLDSFGREQVYLAFYDDLRRDPQRYIDGISAFIGIARIDLGGRSLGSRVVHSFDRAPRYFKLARYGRKLRDWLRERRAARTIEFLARAGVWAACFSGGQPYGPLPLELERRLRAEFLPDVEALERLSGRDLTAWKAPRSDRAQDAVPSAYEAAVVAEQR